LGGPKGPRTCYSSQENLSFKRFNGYAVIKVERIQSGPVGGSDSNEVRARLSKREIHSKFGRDSPRGERGLAGGVDSTLERTSLFGGGCRGVKKSHWALRGKEGFSALSKSRSSAPRKGGREAPLSQRNESTPSPISTKDCRKVLRDTKS